MPAARGYTTTTIEADGTRHVRWFPETPATKADRLVGNLCDAAQLAQHKRIHEEIARARNVLRATLPTNTQDGKAPPPSKRGND